MIEQWLKEYVPGRWLTRGGKVVSVRPDGHWFVSLAQDASRLHSPNGIYKGGDEGCDLIAPVGIWIKHDGGECPVPSGTMVRIRWQDGTEWTAGAADARGNAWSLVVSHFLILDPVSETAPELETWAEVSKPTIGNHAIVPVTPARKHVSDAAFAAFSVAGSNREWMENMYADDGVVLLTTAELDAKESEIARLREEAHERCEYASKIFAQLQISERLRKGVMPNAEESLRLGREKNRPDAVAGESASAETREHVMSTAEQRAMSRALLRSVNIIDRGHKLGTGPEPSHETVEPTPYWKRSGV